VPQVQLQPEQRTRLREGKPRNGCSILAAVWDFYFTLSQSVQIGCRAGGQPLRPKRSRSVKLTTRLIQYRGWQCEQPHTYYDIFLHTFNTGAAEGLLDIALAFYNVPFNCLLSSDILLLLTSFSSHGSSDYDIPDFYIYHSMAEGV